MPERLTFEKPNLMRVPIDPSEDAPKCRGRNGWFLPRMFEGWFSEYYLNVVLDVFSSRRGVNPPVVLYLSPAACLGLIRLLAHSLLMLARHPGARLMLTEADITLLETVAAHRTETLEDN
jgi:hypothetical protein